MKLNENQRMSLKRLPGVDYVLELAKMDPFFEQQPRAVVLRSIRGAVGDLRTSILAGTHGADETPPSDAEILDEVRRRVEKILAPHLIRTVNATGIVVHTNLGRSRLAAAAIANLEMIAGRYSNLEFDLAAGARGLRYTAVEDVLCELTGAAAGMVVNNNAGAVLLCLETLARGRTVIVSRGELVEIGGSFRIPDVMARSGAVLREVGTTNRTHLRDYEAAIDDDTALLLKVHRSNFSIVGFTKEVALPELVDLGRRHRLPVMEDLGSGTFVDLSKFGLAKEPTVQESVASGADVITFSGDKLLGGPQGGLIVGHRPILERIRQNPITRALRIDKLTLAALESTLNLYRDENRAVAAIPTLNMISQPLDAVDRRAQDLARRLEQIGDRRLQVDIIDRPSRVGGGALPLLEIPSKCVAVSVDGLSANALENAMRANSPPVIGRIEEQLFIMDVRTVQDDELPLITAACATFLEGAAA